MITRTTVRSALGALVLLAFGLSCGNEATEPTVSDTMTVSLTTPSTDDGAVAVTLRGPGVSAIQSASTAYLVYWRLATAEEARVIVIGNITGGPLFTVRAGVGNAPSAYSATVDEVASRGDSLLSPTGYRLTVGTTQP